ncbi:MAG: hypothetical protein R3B13_04985 [Polyangiaceae bacterium]
MTASPPSPTSASAPRRGQPRVHRLVVLALRRRLSAQAATLGTWLVTLVYLLLVGAVAASGDPRQSATVIRGALTWLSWFGAGGLALAATGKPNADDAAVDGLAALRGVGARELLRARALASGRRTLSMLWLPVLLLNLVVLPFVRTGGQAASALLSLVGSAVYVVVLAAVVVALVLAARALAPSKLRYGLAAVVLLPELLRGAVPHFPSVPWVLAALREGALRSSGWPG